MRKYISQLVDTLAQRLIALAVGRAQEMMQTYESDQARPSDIYRAQLPAIEYITEDMEQLTH